MDKVYEAKFMKQIFGKFGWRLWPHDNLLDCYNFEMAAYLPLVDGIIKATLVTPYCDCLADTPHWSIFQHVAPKRWVIENNVSEEVTRQARHELAFGDMEAV